MKNEFRGQTVECGDKTGVNPKANSTEKAIVSVYRFRIVEASARISQLPFSCLRWLACIYFAR